MLQTRKTTSLKGIRPSCLKRPELTGWRQNCGIPCALAARSIGLSSGLYGPADWLSAFQLNANRVCPSAAKSGRAS